MITLPHILYQPETSCVGRMVKKLYFVTVAYIYLCQLLATYCLVYSCQIFIFSLLIYCFIIQSFHWRVFRHCRLYSIII